MNFDDFTAHFEDYKSQVRSHQTLTKRKILSHPAGIGSLEFWPCKSRVRGYCKCAVRGYEPRESSTARPGHNPPRAACAKGGRVVTVSRVFLCVWRGQVPSDYNIIFVGGCI
jgi:hypothetical protein